jgi:hypothetical protein
MQAPPSQPVRLHWIPVPPSWLVATALLLLAVLPHQVPAAGRRLLGNPIAAALGIAGAGWLFWRHHTVLGMALLIFFAALYIQSTTTEGFSAPVLNRDKVTQRRRWLGEEILSEDPHVIQERTDDPAITYDKVEADDAAPWFDETAMNRHTEAIQERPVPVYQYDTDDQGGAVGISRGV